MLRTGGNCVARGLGGSSQSGGGTRLPRFLGVSLQSRALSFGPALQRSKVISSSLRVTQPHYGGTLAGYAHARHFWWSSKPTPASPAATNNATTPPPPPEVIAETSSAASTPPPSDFPASTPELESSSSAVAIPLPEGTDAVLTDVVSSSTSTPLVIDPSLIPALQYGDLAALGIASWSPPGLCAWGIELLHVSTGLPWFWTLIGAGMIARLVLFPTSVISMRQTLKLAPHSSQVNSLREQMMAAAKRGDQFEMQASSLKLKVLYEKIGFRPVLMVLAPFVQLPVTLGMFFGVKRLCDFPLEHLKWSGLSWLPDLTVPDPTYILPLAAAAVMNLQLSVGLRDMTASPHAPHLVNLFRALTLIGVPLMANLPAGVSVYLVSSISFMFVQTFLLRVPAVRRALGIPLLSPTEGNHSVSMMESMRYVQKWWETKKNEAMRDQLEKEKIRRR